MYNYEEDKKMIIEMVEKYKNVLSMYSDVVSMCPKVLMSKDRKVSLYGMFLPDENLKFCISEYKGHITKNENNKNYKYFFDKYDRIALTERHYDGELLDYIFYFYSEDYIDIVWYSFPQKKISEVAKVEYRNKVVSRFVEADLLRGKFHGYVENIFDFNDNKLTVTRNTHLPSFSNENNVYSMTSISNFDLI